MSGQYYPPQQQPQGQQQPPYTPHAYPVEKKGIESFFVAKDKIGLFLFLCAGMLIVGFLLLDLMASGLVDYEEALQFLGILAVDVGIIVIIALVLIAAVCRDDLPENLRKAMIWFSGVLLVFVIIMYITKSFMGLAGMMY